MEAGLGRGGGVLPHLAGEAPGAVAALEDLQTVGAFLPLPGAYLPLTQHRLADLGPEVPGTTVALGAVGRTQARVSFMAWGEGSI